MGAIHSTKIQTGPMGKRGPKVDQFFRNFSGWTEPIHWVLDRNFRKFWLNGSRPMVRPFQNQFPIILQATSTCAPTKELCQNPILYLRLVFDVYNFVLRERTRQFFHHPTSNLLKLTKPSWIDKNYACATRSNIPANRFHTETSGLFAFTWYRYEISYRSEILAPVRTRGKLMPGRLAPAWHFCGGIR